MHKKNSTPNIFQSLPGAALTGSGRKIYSPALRGSRGAGGIFCRFSPPLLRRRAQKKSPEAGWLRGLSYWFYAVLLRRAVKAVRRYWVTVFPASISPMADAAEEVIPVTVLLLQVPSQL